MGSQRAQYPLTKEYTLNHYYYSLYSLRYIKVYSLLKGYWALWVCAEAVHCLGPSFEVPW